MKPKFAATGLALLLTTTLVGCSGGASSSNGSGAAKEAVTVKIGVVGDNNEPWEEAAKNLKKDENITVDLVRFSDYVQPNQALADGSIDLNSFQTQIFLDNFNAERGTDITSIGYTLMAPLGIYSKKVKNVSELADGAKVSIPNDVSNGGRALRLLEKAGLITVDPAAGLKPAVTDITGNPKNLQITPLDAAQTARSLQDVDAAVINSGMAVDAGLVPSNDAVVLEEVGEASKPYYNIVAARGKDVDNATYKTVVKYYQSEDVAKVIADSTKGSMIPVWEGAPSVAPAAPASK